MQSGVFYAALLPFGNVLLVFILRIFYDLLSKFRIPQEEFAALCPTLRDAMNVLARRIWNVLAARVD